MWSIQRPSDAAMRGFRQEQEQLSFSYPEVEGTRRGEFPPGYNHDRNEIVLGSGQRDFERAVEGLLSWKMFPSPWARVLPTDFTPVAGGTLTLLFHLAGLHWKSAGRIVYLVDETDAVTRHRLGFAYGTLPGHVEIGEERFTIAWRMDDSVVYELQAFSRPRYWMARLAKPLARRWQRRFVRESQQALKNYVHN